MRWNRSRGFSLLEVMVAMVLASIMLGMGFTGLNKARTSGSSRGLATAVAAEFRLAREKAIAKGSPVAVVIANGVTRSLFFLEGDTMPVVTRTANFSGDYPNGAIAVATYDGPSFNDNMVIPGSKSDEWKARLNSWLPAAYLDCSIFMFTPNGTVVTNDVPAAGGTYRVVVGTGMDVSGGALAAVGEPQTVAISQTGAVETFGHLLGAAGGVNTHGGSSPAVAPPPMPNTDYNEVAPTILRSRVTPPAEEVDGEMVHVLDKGEYLTLEIFATSGDGRPLYAGWKDNPTTKLGNPLYKGAFSVPGAELERMEFYPEYNIADNGEPEEIQQDVWRSVWTWTPPAIAEAGDQYDLTVDVTDAKKTERAALPDMDPVVITPPGEIIFESNRSGRWHLYTIWADGSRTTRLTTGNHDHRCASATADGKLIAYERDGHEVWVMNIDGTGQIRVTDNGNTPTISPAGNTIAFMRGDDVIVRRIDTSGSPSVTLDSAITNVENAPTPSNRIAYSADGHWVYYTASTRDRVAGVRLSFAGMGLSVVESATPAAEVPNTAHDPQVGGIFSGRHGDVYYHADNLDPYIGCYQTGGGAPVAVSSPWRTSVGQTEAYPAISPNEDLLLFCELVGGQYQIFRCPTGGGAWTNPAAGTQLTGDGENLRPAWIHQGGHF